ncbi:UNVERIFIED_CONTAM: hypothetical protein PYX00_011431 [Menopon gallinae]|uniref:Uncharacterized protein n=1 Tax=Menopon gallinae TaxID=328185 RepID=A0AAW2H7M7_9NEOP
MNTTVPAPEDTLDARDYNKANGEGLAEKPLGPFPLTSPGKHRRHLHGAPACTSNPGPCAALAAMNDTSNEEETVYVTSCAIFGDTEDILRKRTVKSSRGDTISFVMETRRSFVPGTYLMKKLREEHRIDTIIYRATVDPDKIKNLLFHCGLGENIRERNYLNRYDWLHARNWEGKSMCFFVPEESIHSFIEAERPSTHGFCIDLD